MDESEVVEFSSGREVGPSWPHEEVYIGQIRQEPAADEEGAHGCTARLGYSHIQDRQHHPCCPIAYVIIGASDGGSRTSYDMHLSRKTSLAGTTMRV